MNPIALHVYTLESPIGLLKVAETKKGIYRIDFQKDSLITKEQQQGHNTIEYSQPNPIVEKQFQQYFSGERKQFTLPLDLCGTPFRLCVWQALITIPYGETRSYKDIGKLIGCDKGARAIGQANGSNPIPILVPCHRVISADGSLGGFSSGLPIKRYLLALEGIIIL